MKDYPILQEKIHSVISAKLQEGAEEARKQLSLFIDYQLSYINTNHVDFVDFKK